MFYICHRQICNEYATNEGNISSVDYHSLCILIPNIQGKVTNRFKGQKFPKTKPLYRNLTRNSLRLKYRRFVNKAWPKTYTAALFQNQDNIAPSVAKNDADYGEEEARMYLLKCAARLYPKLIYKYVFHDLVTIKKPANHPQETGDPAKIDLPTLTCTLCPCVKNCGDFD